MKKIFATLSLMMFFVTVFAQNSRLNTVLNTPLIKNNNESQSKDEIVNGEDFKSMKAYGTTIMSDDFSNPANWIIQNNGSGAKTWTIGTSTDADAIQLANYILPLNVWNPNPATDNKYAYFDAVYYLLNPPAPNYIDVTLEYNGTFDFSSYPAVGIQWYQGYRAFSNDKVYLEYSFDGGTWYASENDELFATTSVNFYAPVFKYVNLTQELGGMSNVKLRFKWSCNSTSSAGGYGWMIDNVTLLGLAENDLITEKIFPKFYGLGNYSKFPYKQRQKLSSVKSLILNNGSLAQNEIFSYVDVYDQSNSSPVFSSASSVPYSSLDFAIRDTTATDTFSFVPPLNLNTYKIRYRNEQIETEAYPVDNADSIYFAVTDTVFARDRTYSGRFAPTNLSTQTTVGDGDYSAVAYYVTTDDTVSSMSVYLSTQSTANTQIQGVLCYYEGGNSLIEKIITPKYTIQANESNKWITLSFRSNFNGFDEVLTAGTLYWVGVKYFWQAITNSRIFIGTDRESRTTLEDWGGGLNYYVKANGTVFGHLDELPIIRLNTDMPAELTGNKPVSDNIAPVLFPNPSSGIFNLNGKNISSLTVFNVMGEIVFETTGFSDQVNLSGLSRGTYFVRIKQENKTHHQKLIIAR